MASVRARIGPADPLYWLTREPDVSLSERELWMLRLVDVPAAVAARGFPASAQLTVPLYVKDDTLGANAGLGAAIWGTVVLAATCPACAVATGITALFFFGAAGAILIADDQPDRLLYLAPGQELTGKLRSVQP